MPVLVIGGSGFIGPRLIKRCDRRARASVETVREWQACLRDSRLLVLPSAAYHRAAVLHEESTVATLRFIGSLEPPR
jgi:nucleoside-diphosphate-sugar epimerase